MGAFFTGTAMSKLVAERAALFGRPPYLDPACGAGDLLLSISAALPLQSTAAPTMTAWSEVLIGADLQSEFTEAARHRLKLAAIYRHASAAAPGRNYRLPEQLGRQFARIRTGDGLRRLSGMRSFPGTVVMNPPFGAVPAPAGCGWGRGLVPRAALFVDAAIDALAPGGTLVAILPDVLRSGARLEKWRKALLHRAIVTDLCALGRFDDYTNVDVFLLVATRLPDRAPASPNAAAWPGSQGSRDTVGARFVVRTGSVVDNRDPAKGPWRPFAKARTLPTAGELRLIERRRRFQGSVVNAPFVLVRRTSRPSNGGSSRIGGLIVLEGEGVAIDNHLLIATPRNGTVAACRELVKVLEAPETSTWLNERIRCRHLTVGIVADIPWSDLGRAKDG